MLQHKVLSLFQLKTTIHFNDWKEIIKNHTLPDKRIRGVNYYGWEKDGDLGIHFSSSTLPFHISEFTACVASIPKGMVARHLDEKLEQMDSSPDAETILAMETEIYEQLLETMPHEKIKVYLIFFETGQIWLCATKSTTEDATLRAIRTIIQRNNNDWDVYSHRITSPVAKRMLANNCTTLNIDPVITFKVSGKMIHSSAENSFVDPDYHASLMMDHPIARITASLPNEDTVLAQLTMDGKLSKVEVTETFKDRWKNAGDPKQADELWSVALGIWVDSIIGLFGECHKAEAALQEEIAEEEINE